MKTIKDIATELFQTGVTASEKNARRYVEKHYDVALPAYLADERANLDLLDGLMSAYTAGTFNDAIKSTLKISNALDLALDHAADLIYDTWDEIEFHARHKCLGEKL